MFIQKIREKEVLEIMLEDILRIQALLEVLNEFIQEVKNDRIQRDLL